MNNNYIRESKMITMFDDWTPLKKIALVLEHENIKSFTVKAVYETNYLSTIILQHGENTAIKAEYNKEDDETVITITNIYQIKCSYCQNGNCILENINCNGYGECKGGASI